MDAAGTLYAGGSFETTGNTIARGVARWDGTAWSALGDEGITFGQITALALGPNGDLYLGGTFGKVGGVPARNVARWDGTRWSALGDGILGQVIALTVDADGKVYVTSENAVRENGNLVYYVSVWDPSASP